MSEILVDVQDLRKTFEEGRIVAVSGMNLQVSRGEFVAVVGPSGCGKSTLLHLIAALDEPDSGSIHVGGHALETHRELSHYRARHVGMVFQLHNLLPTLTAIENVQVPMFELGLSARERRRRARDLLRAVELEGRERNRPPQLSGGERQRVAIARALANEPPILLADEPTGSLDSAAGRTVLDLIERLRTENGLTIVLVTHDQEVAARADPAGAHAGRPRAPRAAGGPEPGFGFSAASSGQALMLGGCGAEQAAIMATVARLPGDQLLEISELADLVGLVPAEIEPYGRDKAKIDLSVLDRLSTVADGKLIAVTAITPTKSGEGKTTTAIALTEGLGFIGERSLVCLREPSVGPTLGAKGGGTGAGLAQVVPGQDINLHFTGDLHAIAAANNLLASAVDAHLIHDNELGIDPATITWRRCLDIEDRLLRRIAVGLGEDVPFPRECGFDITAASEVMALLAMARDRDDLRHRLGAITVARTFDAEPVTAEHLDVAGAMAVLLKDALKPNLVQTLEGQPALVHAGPFANIAHGNSSLVGDLVGLKLADYVVTEGGFGSDLGFEKLVHIVCRAGGLSPAAVVLVVTTQALKRHGGDPDGGLPALARGGENLAAHLRIVKELGFDAVVAVNRFPGDSQLELEAVSALALEHGAFGAAVSDGYERGGVGASALAEIVVEAARRDTRARFVYELDDPIETKLDALARRIYGGAGVELSPAARDTLERLPVELHRVPVCVAKTHLSLSHDPELVGAPRDFVLPVRELRPYTGAGWVVAVCGDTQTMPGLPAHSAAERMDLDADGRIVGLA